MVRFPLHSLILLGVNETWGYYPPPVKYSIAQGRVHFYHKNRLLEGLYLPWDDDNFWTKLCHLWWDGKRGGIKGLEPWTHYWIHPMVVGEVYNTLLVHTGRGYEPIPMSNVPSKPIPLSMQEIYSILGMG